MSSREPNTPGVVGYGIGALASCAFCTPLVLIPALFDGEAPWIAIVFLPLAFALIVICGSPVAVVGVLTMELVCRRVRWQPAHVLVASIAGYAATAVYLRVTGMATSGPDATFIAGCVAVAAGFGRALVIPMVDSRRARMTSDGFLPRPVDR
ncbi:MAG TPA: hypothetical protein VFE15_16465 [Marmoricola sp.]|nr:hypothetical protein [Marmoricola sp.]